MSGSGWMAAGAALLTGLLTAGCSAQAKRVNCEGRLEPINQPVTGVDTEPVREDFAKVERTAL